MNMALKDDLAKCTLDCETLRGKLDGKIFKENLSLKKEIEEKEFRISILEKDKDEKDNRIQKLNRTIEEKNNRIHNLEQYHHWQNN
jgi:chromosome segregation ATPase